MVLATHRRFASIWRKELIHELVELEVQAHATKACGSLLQFKLYPPTLLSPHLHLGAGHKLIDLFLRSQHSHPATYALLHHGTIRYCVTDSSCAASRNPSIQT